MCQQKRQTEVKGVKILETFFSKAAQKSVPERASSQDDDQDDQDQFDGADAIVSEK